MSEFDKIAAALPAVKGLGDASDAEFDALAQRATDAYDDLMDLGMNVEARYSGRIFEVAGGMLKNAIDAKAANVPVPELFITVVAGSVPPKLAGLTHNEATVGIAARSYFTTTK